MPGSTCFTSGVSEPALERVAECIREDLLPCKVRYEKDESELRLVDGGAYGEVAGVDFYASSDSASASALELAATIAGAITIPTKAIAIMRSCIVFSPRDGLDVPVHT